MKNRFILLLIGVLCIVSCKKKPFVCGETVTDMDGNVYHTVSIGTQCWMKENLRTSKYNNGISISTNYDNTAWKTTISGVYAIYYNDESYNSIYGKLYNWNAVHTGALAPEGWHVPDTTEWNTLINFLGGDSVSGDKMKKNDLWLPYIGISNTNSSGFSALPGGIRVDSTGFYEDIVRRAYFWSSTELGRDSAYFRLLNYNSSDASSVSSNKHIGISVRCIKD